MCDCLAEALNETFCKTIDVGVPVTFCPLLYHMPSNVTPLHEQVFRGCVLCQDVGDRVRIRSFTKGADNKVKSTTFT